MSVGNLPHEEGTMNSKITSEDNKGTKDSEELYISKYGMKRDELVVWT